MESIKRGSEIVGNRVKVRVVKNKVAPPFRVAEFDIMFNEGISREGDLLDVATEMSVLTKRGAFYSYGDTRLGQGRENSKEFMRENPDVTEEIEEKVRAMLNPETEQPELPDESEAARPGVVAAAS
jgi:recombination protein RecA